MLSTSSASASSQEPITPPAMPVTTSTAPGMACRWKDCAYIAPSPDSLYEHLCNAHIGRKSTNNLCLVCAWEGCGVKCVKRDHITSHLRVHTPLKPHTCAVCPKTFKRPQDLKKHERIHTQEHHQLHKHSKAATTDDPTLARRVAAETYGLPSQAAMNSLSPASLSSQSVSPASSHSQILGGAAFPPSPYEHLLPAASASGHSPIPPPALAALHRKQHEELAAYQARELLVLQQLANQQAQAGAAGAKRGWQDETINHFDGFYADMKKRRMEPVYDAEMIDRLNSLVPPSLGQGNAGAAYPSMPSYFTPHFQPHPQHAQAYPPPPPPTSFNPHPPSFQPDIRSEHDLAMFNQFMVTLGRDASGYGQAQAQAQQMEPSVSGSTSGSSAGGDDLFDHEALASLGLTGMPGIPEQPATVNFGSVYPALDLGLNNRRNTSPGPGPSDGSKRAIAGLPRPATFSLAQNPRSASLSDGSASAPGFYEDASSLYDFDSLARARGAALPSAHVAPKEFYRKNYRAVEPLGAARPLAVARESAERSGIEEADEEEDEGVSPPLPLRALLNDEEGDPAYKLAAISVTRSSQSPCSSSSSRDASPLPSIDAALHAGFKRPTTADGLARQVKRLEIDVDTHLARPEDGEGPGPGPGLTEREKRRLHALWIRALVVTVNEAFRARQAELAEEESGSGSESGTETERTGTPGVVAC